MEISRIADDSESDGDNADDNQHDSQMLVSISATSGVHLVLLLLSYLYH